MKIYIIPILMLIMMFTVSAYDLGSTVNIYAEYRINGVLTDADANISIKFPSGEFDTIAYDQVMDNISVGRFNYTYNCNVTGTHIASVIFFNTTGDAVGSDAGEFVCGNVNGFSLGRCPDSTVGFIGVWIFMAFMLAVAITGIAMKYPVLPIISGFIYLIMATVLWGCSDVISYTAALLGIAFLLIGFTIKT